MILVIAAKSKLEERFSVTASVKYFLLSMPKVFSFSKLLQQARNQEFSRAGEFSWN